MTDKQIITTKEGNFELVCNAPIYTSYITFNGSYIRKSDSYNVGNQLILFYNIIDPTTLELLPKEQWTHDSIENYWWEVGGERYELR